MVYLKETALEVLNLYVLPQYSVCCRPSKLFESLILPMLRIMPMQSAHVFKYYKKFLYKQVFYVQKCTCKHRVTGAFADGKLIIRSKLKVMIWESPVLERSNPCIFSKQKSNVVNYYQQIIPPTKISPPTNQASKTYKIQNHI